MYANNFLILSLTNVKIINFSGKNTVRKKLNVKYNRRNNTEVHELTIGKRKCCGTGEEDQRLCICTFQRQR